jgi:hypothetical protein
MGIEIRALRYCPPFGVEEDEGSEIVWFRGEENSVGRVISKINLHEYLWKRKGRQNALLNNLIGETMENIRAR